MKRIFAAAAITLAFVPSCVLAQERTGDAALGALSGAVVLGPIGAVAGAVVGYTAGPSIAHSWGLRRSEGRHGGRSGRGSGNAASNEGASSTQGATTAGPVEGDSMSSANLRRNPAASRTRCRLPRPWNDGKGGILSSRDTEARADRSGLPQIALSDPGRGPSGMSAPPGPRIFRAFSYEAAWSSVKNVGLRPI
jgi:hypothetical protein